VLSAFGLSDGNDLLRQDMANIRQALDELGKQVTQVQNRVELAGFSELVHQTDPTTGKIDYAMEQLAALANLPADDPTKRGFTEQEVVPAISNLRDAPAILNRNLGSDVPLADNLIKSASRLLSVRERFFDKETSDQVKSVYDYFAAYQAKLAILLVEYYHTKPDIYSTTTIEGNLKKIEGNVSAQATSLKPRVPDGTVVDTKTGRMWMQTIDGSSLRKLSDFAILVDVNIPYPGYYGTFRLTNTATSTAVPGLPFDNWGMPQTEDFWKLLSYRGNDSPLDFLAKRARISRQLLDAANSHVWVRDTFIWPVPAGRLGWLLEYRLFSLRAGDVAGPTRVPIDKPANWRTYFDSADAQAILYLRQRSPGEEYWWG
jgi:hypothetical protein